MEYLSGLQALELHGGVRVPARVRVCGRGSAGAPGHCSTEGCAAIASGQRAAHHLHTLRDLIVSLGF